MVCSVEGGCEEVGGYPRQYKPGCANWWYYRYRSFTPEQEGVYAIIDDAGQDGIWSKTVKTRFGLHDSIFAREIKFLLGKKYISEMKSVEHPTRKMYIKSTLTPSERATGGPWYTDGELDEELIGAVTQLLRGYTIRTTFYQTRIESSKRPKKVINNKNLTPEEVQAKRANGLGPPPTVKIKTEDSTSHSEHVSALTERKRKLASYLPMPSTYQNYPSLDVLTLFVDNSKILKEGTVLTSSDISQLLDIMIYDGNLTKVVSGDRVGYKAQRKALYEEEELGGVLSEVPCGRCPVFDLCEEGGPVGPSNCVYFSKWLEGGY